MAVKAALVNLRMEVELQLGEKEVAILHHVTSYDLSGLAEFMAKHYGGYKEHEYLELLQNLREEMRDIVESTGAARRYLFDERYGSRKGRRRIVPGLSVVPKAQLGAEGAD